MSWPFGTVLRDPDTGGMVMVCGPTKLHDRYNLSLFPGIIVRQPSDGAYDDWAEEWTGLGETGEWSGQCNWELVDERR